MHVCMHDVGMQIYLRMLRCVYIDRRARTWCICRCLFVRIFDCIMYMYARDCKNTSTTTAWATTSTESAESETCGRRVRKRCCSWRSFFASSERLRACRLGLEIPMVRRQSCTEQMQRGRCNADLFEFSLVPVIIEHFSIFRGPLLIVRCLKGRWS